MADPITMMAVGSTVLSVAGTLEEGKGAVRAAEFEAGQLEEQATARYARGTREAYEAKRAGDIMESRARAVMAAGGGLASDPQAIEQLGRIGAESEYEALTAMYEGETEAAGLRRQAAARRYGGKMKKRAAKFKALSTAISGGSKAYESYKKPKAD